jgi:hypothetical protein
MRDGSAQYAQKVLVERLKLDAVVRQAVARQRSARTPLNTRGG